MESASHDGTYIISGKLISQINAVTIAQLSPVTSYEELGSETLDLVDIAVNEATFLSVDGKTRVSQQQAAIHLTCTCTQPKSKLCSHKSSALLQIIANPNYIVFFDDNYRREKLRKFAADYGLEAEPELDEYFDLELNEGRLVINPKDRSLLPVTNASIDAMERQLMLQQASATPRLTKADEELKRIIVFKQHKFYKHLIIELYDADSTKDGRIKNPLIPVAPLQLIMDTNDPFEIKFYTAISRFQQNIDAKVNKQGLDSLKAIVKNPLNFDCYLHDVAVSEKVPSGALTKVNLRALHTDLQLTVDPIKDVFKISGSLPAGEERYPVSKLEVLFGYFIKVGSTLYLVKNLQTTGAITLFKQGQDYLHVHKNQFKEFQSRILNKLDAGVKVSYPYIPTATAVQLQEQQFNHRERIIYLSDFGQYIMIFPVMRYGEAEIPVRKNDLIYAIDSRGEEFLVQRDEPAEREFIAAILKQHAYFEEQLADDLQYFYLHKKRFLDEEWFLNAFEVWRAEGIAILGFNELTGNNLNPHKVSISIKVLSGLNWFNTKLDARFGKRKASLKHLHKAIRNKTKYVQLDDGTLGILPQEWIDKFTRYFEAAQIVDEELLTPKTNFELISELYEDQQLGEQVKLELQQYRNKFDNLEKIEEIGVPAELKTTLRPYQQFGLNWLNFLDELNFGGCLADDMGLGKTIQVLAFILSQNTKAKQNTNLLVVPTSLIFNWQAEAERFAPSLKILTLYGADRVKNIADFNSYNIVLTSYGTLLSDINFLKNYTFNYVFLDESQNIKNPTSQRYKAAKLLKARNRIAVTGTPFENNTFDIYGQLSFACPGLLGSLQYFKEIYAMPVDQFKVSKRARELQQKIKPFILRRTKQEVAAELPEKTEMVLHCPMNEEQRTLYNAYEKEFREFISATSQDQLKKSSMHVLKGITKLRQICDSPQLLEGVRLPGNASAKIDVLLEQIESKSPNHKILVFSQFVGMLNLIRKELLVRNIGFAYLTGATKNREQVVNNFQENADTRVFLISLKAGGTGLNLTAADYVYLVDPWWNPAIENQAIDRVYRIGQHKNVVAVRMICPDTIEEKVVRLQENKRDLANKLITSDAVLQSLSKEDWMDLLRPL
ncbi:ATP-dependent helicase [Mucilaginibacter terrenus]|uniref:ATP-dependent helicase n=1 Tax=Mucilaginibacter terrenus TaxID=2482727 RepID=A0A3E2NTH2_9SPHI|nr:DEAD/DEAH box helicase [Mucilaginibacter terrenus]RFZ84269.1 ATP-dependent helicase [Mucilaginibacter terrenus]